MKDIKQLTALDGLRVLATLAIFLNHASILKQGTFPVTWFFMLTGFMMYYTKHTLDKYPNYVSWLGYVWKKIKEFYPIYFVTFIYAFVLAGMDFGKDNLRSAVINIFMLQPFFPDLVYDFNGLSWYLAATIFLYLIGYFLIKLVKKIKKYIPIVMVVIIGITLTLNIGLRLGYDLYTYSNPVYRILDCMLGMMIAELFMTRDFASDEASATRVEYILGISFVLMYFVSLIITAMPAYYTILFCVAMYVFANGKGMISRFLGMKNFVVISKYSFYFYMIHELVLRTFRLLIPVGSMNFYVRMFVIAIISFVITSCLSVLCKKVYDTIFKKGNLK